MNQHRSRTDSLVSSVDTLSAAKRTLLTARLRQMARGTRASIPLRPRTQGVNCLPLSFAQERLWFLAQLESDKPHYNITDVFRLTGPLDVEAFRRSLGVLTQRHEVLRTTFPAGDGTPVQRITTEVQVSLQVTDFTDVPASVREERAKAHCLRASRQPFDLAHAPVFRCEMLRLDHQEHVFLLVIHHIIFDAWTARIFYRELSNCYNRLVKGQPIGFDPLPIQYADFASWQREYLTGETLQSHLTYWQERLAGFPGHLELSTDFPRPGVPAHHGAKVSLTLDRKLSDEIRALTRREEASTFMTLLAAFQVLLHRYTGQEDLCVGSPIANRTRPQTEQLMGCLLNTLALRTDLSGDPTFREILRRVRRVALEAYAHQDLPFEKLVEALRPERDLNRPPLFQVFFDMLSLGKEQFNLQGLAIQRLEPCEPEAKYDLSLYARERDGRINLWLVYDTDLFRSATAQALLTHLQVLLEAIAENPEQKISRLPILTETEQHRLLVQWNDTARAYPPDSAIHALVERQAECRPDSTALVFEGQRLTYRQLNEKANRLARYLRRLGVSQGSFVGLCMERSPDMVVALLAILKAGAAYVPLDPTYPGNRLLILMRDAGLQVLVTQTRLRDDLAPDDMAVVSPDQEPIGLESPKNPACRNGPEDAAYVVYTSGSSGTPKGVIVSHRAVCNHLHWRQQYSPLGEGDAFLQKASLALDTGAWEILWPLAAGARTVLAQPGGEKDPAYLARLIMDEGVTTAHFTPSALATFLEESHVKRCRCLRRVFCGGEAMSTQLRDRFFACLDAELYHQYGSTETCIDITIRRCIPGQDEHAVPMGRPIANTQVYILDRYGNPVPVGVIGELHVGGLCLATGYLNQKDLTDRKFISNPFDPTPGSRLYRTGDLARYLPSGDIEFAGRIGRQIKLRGFRIEPGEIEAALRKHPAIREAVVTAARHVQDQRLVAYCVLAQEAAATDRELQGFLRVRLPEHMVPAGFVRLTAMPRTASGKVDIRSLPVPTNWGIHETYTAPRTLVEDVLAEIWSDVLGIDSVGSNDNFFDLGGHSLVATRVISRIGRVFQIELPLRRLFEKPVLADLAKEIERQTRDGHAPTMKAISRVARDRGLPLSFAQQRLWFLDRLEPNNTAYNVTSSVRLRGPLHTTPLERALNEVVRRHEALRTCFPSVKGEPAQVIAASMKVPLPVVAVDGRSVEQRLEAGRCLAGEAARCPFDLAEGPLVRAKLLQIDTDDHILVISMHHIVSDAWSLEILWRELRTLYDAFSNQRSSPLPELPIQYADFSVWQREQLAPHVLPKQLAYWREKLGHDMPILELATDRPRPPVVSYRGASHSRDLYENLARQIRELGRAEGATPFMTLLAAFKVLLYRYTRQEDVVLGSAIAARCCDQVEDLIGFFANTLVLCTNLSGNPTFRTLLRRVRQVALEAYGHQDLPFERLVEELQPQRDTSRTPLFQVVFGLQSVSQQEVPFGDLQAEPFPLPHRTAKFDLSLHIIEKPGQLTALANYNTDIFEGPSIARLLNHFQTLLEAVVTDPDARIDELPIVGETERHQLLVEWNKTTADYPRNTCIHALFAEQARRNPQATAVVCGDRELTYGQLNQRANQLAHSLRRAGAKPGILVGIGVERSIEMVVGLLGILKAGGAYVPLDPSYPSDRLALMLEEAQVPLMLGLGRSARLPVKQGQVIYLDSDWERIARESQEDPISDVTGDDPIYVVFTSGSTGKPKGAEVYHHSFVNLVHWYITEFNLNAEDRTLLLSSLSFDLTQKNVFAPLIIGGQLHLPPPQYYEPRRVLQTMANQQITWLNCSPSAFYPLVDQAHEDLWAGLGWLRYVFLGGEPISMSRLRRWMESSGGTTRIVNTYGPTECSDVVAFYTVTKPEAFWDSDVPIGRPIHNSLLFVLDPNLHPVPPGVKGELYIGGVPVGAGYVSNAELTAECFIPSPYSNESRLYKTGDLAKYLPDGNIKLCGRVDQQVKIHGYRIEPGEIEHVLAQHPGVEEAVVVASADHPGNERLVAYLVARDKQRLTARELRDCLAQRLPSYMIPSAFVFLDGLPLTPSGKLDRNALPAPHELRPELSSHFVAPRTPIEQALATIWAELLGIDKVGIHDNFFELGGHSLLMVRVISRIKSTLDLDLPIRRLFETPTVADLAASLEQGHEDGARVAAVSNLMQFVSQLSDEEVDRILTEQTAPERVARDDSYSTITPVVATDRALPARAKKATHTDVENDAVKIRSLAFPTADRVDSLRQCVASYVENCKQHGRQCDYIVADDAASADARSACRRMLRGLQRDHDVPIFYAGPEEKRHFAEKLIGKGNLPADVVHFALFDVERTGTSTGANRNALLLATIGEAVFSADDDTRCHAALAPQAKDEVTLATGHDPADFWVFPDRETAMRSAFSSVDRDVLADHEQFLGRHAVSVLGREAHRRGLGGDEMHRQASERLEHANSRMMVTLNGLLGDCGWNSPFSYLLWTGPSHERLVCSEDIYRQACRSREILRVAERPTLSDATFVMSTFMGLDNRELLPPFMPVMRGQDHIFGLTLWRCLAHGWFVHLPVALVHQPAAARRFWPGEVFRGATGFSSFHVILECIKSAHPENVDRSGSARLQALGDYLMDLGRMPLYDFESLLQQWVRSSRHQFMTSVYDRLRTEPAAPHFWVRDLERYVQLLDRAVSSENYCVPLDLPAGDSTDEPRQLMHRLVFRFGQLLYWWPSLVEAAKDLRRQGHRLAGPVERTDHD